MTQLTETKRWTITSKRVVHDSTLRNTSSAPHASPVIVRSIVVSLLTGNSYSKFHHMWRWCMQNAGLLEDIVVVCFCKSLLAVVIAFTIFLMRFVILRDCAYFRPSRLLAWALHKFSYTMGRTKRIKVPLKRKRRQLIHLQIVLATDRLEQ